MIKPIVEVEINDSAFARFYELFQQYQTEIGEQPEKWRELNDVMDESTRGLEAGALSAKEALALAAAQAGIIAEALHAAVEAQHNLQSATKSSGKAMDGLAKSARSVGHGIGKVVSGLGSLLSKAGPLALVGGIFAGLGSIDLMDAAFTRLRGAGQLGMSTGAYGSFRANMQQFLGTPALSGAANAQNDLSQLGWMSALGISPDRAWSMDPGQLAITEAWKAAQAYKAAPHMAAQNVRVIAYEHLGGNIEELRNIAAHGGTYAAAASAYRRDKTKFNVDNAAQAWANLKIQIDKSGMALQSDLIDKLSPLAPELAKLAQDLSGATDSLIGSKGFQEAVEFAVRALGQLPGVLQKIEKFGAEVGVVADKFAWLLPKKPDKKPVPLEKQNLRQLLWTYDDWGDLVIKGAKQFGHDFMDELLHKKKYDYGADGIGHPVHNPLDMKIMSHGKTGFAQFKSTAAGIRAGAKRLLEYPSDWNAHTLAQIIKVWAPSDDGNNPNGYTSNVERWSGVNRNLAIEKYTKKQLAAVIAAMSREEGTDRVSISQVMKALFDSHQPTNHEQMATSPARAPQSRPVKKLTRAHAPVHVSISNSTAARVAVSFNAVAVA